MGIIKIKETNYYELDWDVPTEYKDKVYMAIKGEIESNTSLNIMADGVGYEWEEDEKSRIQKISEKEFLEKARIDNIVYFYDDEPSYNELLNYPNKLQKSIDLELYKDGFTPHNRISLKDKFEILKYKYECKKELKNFERSKQEKWKLR